MTTRELPGDIAGRMPNPAKPSGATAFLPAVGIVVAPRSSGWPQEFKHVSAAGSRRLASAPQPAFLSVVVSSARLNRARKAWASAACLKQ
jgi:hypothetical protein